MNFCDQKGCTPLIRAVLNGCPKIVSSLLEKQDIQVNLANNYEDTPLILAAWEGYEEVVNLLLKKEIS